MAPSYLCRSFAPVSSVHNHHTRGSIYDYHISRDDIPGCFSHFGKNQWNNLPVEPNTDATHAFAHACVM